MLSSDEKTPAALAELLVARGYGPSRFVVLGGLGGDHETVEETTPAGAEKGEKLKAELDELLDEIDEVLEENAEDFVRSYVQKGGQ